MFGSQQVKIEKLIKSYERKGKENNIKKETW